MERVHRLRELSLMAEEDRSSWAALPEVVATNCSGERHLHQSYKLF